ncbi:cytochrome P450 [Phyllosticta citrichinensis]|uniref:Cytochrome P450 n=1 Tax=Phyllosticta citrichinensis TaxID=1130410 RepID=A0ABR1Y8D2_9PEZI
MFFAVKAIIFYWLVHRIWRVFYNFFLHPLRAYPGPVLYRATCLPRFYDVMSGRSAPRMTELHEKYGTVVRYSPDELSFIEGDAWKTIYVNGNNKAPFAKEPAHYPLPPDMPAGLLQDLDDASHRRQRQVFSSAFSERALKDQEPLLRTHVERLMARLTELSNQDVDITDYLNFVAFDIMGDLAMGASLGLLVDRDSKFAPWVRTAVGSIKLLIIRSALGFYAPLLAKVLLSILAKPLKKKREEHGKHTMAQVTKRLSTKTDRPDFWTLVLDGKKKQGADGGPPLSLGEMHANASLFMIGGTETTATLLSGALYLLLANPACLRRLTDEVRGAFASPDDISLEALPRCLYLNAVLEESLRVYPPVAEGLHRVAPAGGAVVCGHFVPEGTVVQIPHYATYHSALNFFAPHSFHPDRWLPDAATNPASPFFADKRRALQPFGVGPRNCIGRNLAYHEMRLVLARLVWGFDVGFADRMGMMVGEGQGERDGDWMGRQKAWAVWEKPPLWLRFVPVVR